MKKGDIVLIKFPFSDLSGSKNRPALVLISRESDVVVSFITSNIIHSEHWDIVLEPSLQNGLKKISTIKISKLATLEKALVLGKIGEINFSDILKVNKSLTVLFQIHS
ncbi:MAG: type II toxin-antitoxin system PemK/MazF family toxin [Aequorivita sp.]|nr:type II toxin-antitoxin system PemK/MazF family toxin [Aequorivita sp.]